MALTGLTESSNLELSNMLFKTVFEANKAKEVAQEQLQPTVVEDMRKTDFVSLSAQAVQLSREALISESPAEETKQSFIDRSK